MKTPMFAKHLPAFLQKHLEKRTFFIFEAYASFLTWLRLIKVIIPVTILTKVLTELDLIKYLALPIKPLMHLVGLPPDLGLVWVTGIITNVFSGLFVFVALVPTLSEPLTAAQATTLALMLLVAHALPVEGKVAQFCGVSMTFQLVLRFFGAILFGFTFYHFCNIFNLYQEPAKILFPHQPDNISLVVWTTKKLLEILVIFPIIFLLMASMRILERIGVIQITNALLSPLFSLVGISKKATSITIIGLTVGLSYGGGLISNAVNEGRVSRRDVFRSMTFLGFSHSIIEDTLIVGLIGAQIGGTLGFRLALSFLLMFLFSALYSQYMKRKQVLETLPQPTPK